MRPAFVIAGTLALSACISNPRIENLSPQQRAKLSSIAILESAPPREFDIVGSVKGISCHRNIYTASELSDREALDGIKLRAVQLNADAVINVYCQKNTTTDWANNCWGSIRCIGDAVRFKDQ